MPVMHFLLVKTKPVANNVVATVSNNLEDKVVLPLFVDDTSVEEIGKAIEAYKDSFMAKPIETIPNSIAKEKVMEDFQKLTNIACSAVVD